VRFSVQRTSRYTHIVHIGCRMRSLGYLTPGFSANGTLISNQSSRLHLLSPSGQIDLQSAEGDTYS
jgi:hypothetical protein